MTRRLKGRFAGAIRLVPDVDTIGVPVFVALRGNEMFVPEMDGDFRIQEFMEFYNEQGFQITYELPREFRNQVFELGTSAPIPFWISGQCHVIVGDADKDEPQKLFGEFAKRNEVLLDLARLLDDARSGRIRDRFDNWTAESISNGFADVFYEEPVRSRYWVTRYRVAVANARRLTKPPHPIDAKLRNVATEWFHKFGTKTDLSKLGGMLGKSSNQILSKRQITDILFAFLMNQLVQDRRRELETYYREESLHQAFPMGLHAYYLENGWPRVPFYYEQDANFVGRMLNGLADANEQDNFEEAAKLAFLLYGRGAIPEQTEALARTYFKYIEKDFRRMREDARDVFRDRSKKYLWPEYAEGILECYDQLLDLDGIIHGKERMRRVPVNHRFGVTLEYLKDLRSIRKREW